MNDGEMKHRDDHSIRNHHANSPRLEEDTQVDTERIDSNRKNSHMHLNSCTQDQFNRGLRSRDTQKNSTHGRYQNALAGVVLEAPF